MLYLRAGFSNKCNCNYSIFITFNYNPNYVNLVKSLPIRKWDATSKCWEIPLDSRVELLSLLFQYNILKYH